MTALEQMVDDAGGAMDDIAVRARVEVGISGIRVTVDA